MQVQQNGKWLSADMGGERAMMSIETGAYVTLSRVGARIWELIEQPAAVEAICARLTEEFDVPADLCRAEVDAFLAVLEGYGAITVS